jgi:hypothetical protein
MNKKGMAPMSCQCGAGTKTVKEICVWHTTHMFMIIKGGTKREIKEYILKERV